MKATRLVACVVCVAWLQVAAAQPLAQVEIGWQGVPVAGAWNPIRVQWRDLGAGSLSLTIERGTLAQPLPDVQVTVPIAGGVGVGEVDADVFIPAFRRLAWRVEAGGVTVASGSLARDAVSRGFLDVFVAPNAPGSSWPGHAIELEARELRDRPASYDGVRSLWISPEVAREAPRAWVAAAAAGAVVVAPTELLLVFPLQAGWNALGAGGVWVGDAPSFASLEAARIPLGVVAEELSRVRQTEPRRYPTRGQAALAGALFVTMVLLSLRLPAAAGGVTALTWVVFAVVAASVFAGRQAQVQTVVVERVLAAGGLGLVVRGHEILSDRRVAAWQVPDAGWVPGANVFEVGVVPAAVAKSHVTLGLQRGQVVHVLTAPFVRELPLRSSDPRGVAEIPNALRPFVANALGSESGVTFELMESPRW